MIVMGRQRIRRGGGGGWAPGRSGAFEASMRSLSVRASVLFPEPRSPERIRIG
jgi:hypothetical protein